MSNNNLKTVEKICKILNIYTLEKPQWGVSEMSSASGLSKSVVYRILTSLKSEGFLYQDARTNKYQLGNEFIKLGRIASNNMNLIDYADEEVANLHNKTNETILIDIPEKNGFNSICIHKKESNKKIIYTCGLGEKVPLYAGAIGKVILANSSAEKINSVIKNGLKKHAANTTINENKLKEELEIIRKKGYSVTNNEWNTGGMAISAPIFNELNKVIASIGILGPEFRLRNKVDQYIESCLKASKTISRHYYTE